MSATIRPRVVGLAALLALPLLLGSFPEECPPPSTDDIAFEATVTSVEQRSYTCDPTDLALLPRRDCVEIPASAGLCGYQDVTLRVADGTTRTGKLGSGVGIDWCELPPGRHAIALCTEAGTLDCSIDLRGDGSSRQVALRGSLPYRYRYRYRVHAGAPVSGLGDPDLTLDSDIALTAGSTMQFVVPRSRGDAIPVIARCGARSTASSPSLRSGRGCAHCSAGELDHGGLALLGITLALLHRRSR